MTSPAQAASNARNSARSTGPRTEAGKRRSRMNAVRHGAYLQHGDSITAGLLDEDPNEVEALHRALVEDLAPASALQYTQAAQIAQQIVNQLRIHRLTSSLAEAEDIGTDFDDLIGRVRHEHWFWEQLTWAVGTRHDTQVFEIDYYGLAIVLHSKNKTADISPPELDRDAEDPLEANRQELLRIVEAVYGPLDDAFDTIKARRDELVSKAERETRTAHGIEAKRLLEMFERSTSIHDRVARSIARDLKIYRELKHTEAELIDTIDEEEDSPTRNEPNPNM